MCILFLNILLLIQIHWFYLLYAILQPSWDICMDYKTETHILKKKKKKHFTAYSCDILSAWCTKIHLDAVYTKHVYIMRFFISLWHYLVPKAVCAVVLSAYISVRKTGSPSCDQGEAIFLHVTSQIKDLHSNWICADPDGVAHCRGLGSGGLLRSCLYEIAYEQ